RRVRGAGTGVGGVAAHLGVVGGQGREPRGVAQGRRGGGGQGFARGYEGPQDRPEPARLARRPPARGCGAAGRRADAQQAGERGAWRHGGRGATHLYAGIGEELIVERAPLSRHRKTFSRDTTAGARNRWNRYDPNSVSALEENGNRRNPLGREN